MEWFVWIEYPEVDEKGLGAETPPEERWNILFHPLYKLDSLQDSYSAFLFLNERICWLHYILDTPLSSCQFCRVMMNEFLIPVEEKRITYK